MIATITRQCDGTCMKSCTVTVDTESRTIIDFSSEGGCELNLRAIGKLMIGCTCKDIYSLFSNVECGRRGTSCQDQIARCIEHFQ